MKELSRSRFDCHGYIAFKVRYDDGSRRTILQHREVMEKHLGRTLHPSEVVHHIDKDKTNNAIENLEVLSRADHARHHHREPEFASVVCPECATDFAVSASRVRHNQEVKGGDGPFCSRRCAGRHNARKRAR